MKKILLLFISITLLASGCAGQNAERDLNRTSDREVSPVSEEAPTEMIGDESGSLPETTMPYQVQPEDMQAAKGALIGFFDALANKDYGVAISYYRGPYDIFYDWNPGIDKYDKPLIWSRACENNGLRCLKVKNVVKSEYVHEGDFIFTVQFANPDGTTFQQLPCCGAEEGPIETNFLFEVKKVDLNFYVVTRPIYTP